MLNRKNKRNKRNKKTKKRQKESNSNALLGLMAVVMLLIVILNQLIQSSRIETLIDQQIETSEKIKIKEDLINDRERQFDSLFESEKEKIANAFYDEENWKFITPRTASWEGK